MTPAAEKQVLADTASPLAALSDQLIQVDQAIDHRADLLKGLE